ncbi:MAG TPA: hypothetical protein VJG13_04660 [Thermoanaerobaculia bacterium]|nr:hypothetical protein [Thermoanaerobaculia bacterium]
MSSVALCPALRVVVGLTLLYLMVPAAASAQAEKCSDADAWAADIPLQTVCGCTREEAVAIAKAVARNRCAADPDAVNCAPRTCAVVHNRCETVVVGAGVGVVGCGPAPAAAVGCPTTCPGKPVQCTVPAQGLDCDCRCQSGACEVAHWPIRRELNLGCVANNEAAKRAAARDAFIGACDDVPFAVPCPGRVCHGAPAPACNPWAHGAVKIDCVEDRNCLEGEVRCTTTGSVACTCKCG